MPSRNRVLLSAAGSGKTTFLAAEAQRESQRRIAVLTYTVENREELARAFTKAYGCVPPHVTIETWFRFLLRECVRPYQNFVYSKKRIENLIFVNGRSTKYTPKTDVEKYYLFDGKLVYSDKLSSLAVECNSRSGGRVVSRLSEIYDDLYIDEVQDLAGYDLELLQQIMESKISLTLVGDVRQATYSTNESGKNSAYKREKIWLLFEKWRAAGKCSIEERSWSYRCTQQICDLADRLYPGMPDTVSRNLLDDPHLGVFQVQSNDVAEYVQTYKPIVLRYDAKTDCMGMEAANFGAVKGQTHDRVLIFPNGVLTKVLRSGNTSLITAPAKYYVAMTRARFSLAFVFDQSSALPGIRRFEGLAKTAEPVEGTGN